jgi:hypothetical protein
MNDINPADTQFFDQINSLQDRLYKLETTPQPYVGDWQILNPSEYAYISATTLSIVYDATTRFSVSDKLHIQQGGVDKYFYIIALTSSIITITGGTSYTFTNDPITLIEFSRISNAFGFPPTFTFDPNFRTPGVNVLAGSPSNSSFLFWVEKGICYVDMHFDGDDLSGPSSSIVGDLPVQPATDYLTATNAPFYPCFGVNNFSIQTAGTKLSTSASYDFETLIIEYPGTGGFGLWGASANGVGVDITAMPYLI